MSFQLLTLPGSGRGMPAPGAGTSTSSTKRVWDSVLAVNTIIIIAINIITTTPIIVILFNPQDHPREWVPLKSFTHKEAKAQRG